MLQSPSWEANVSSARQEISCRFWNREAYIAYTTVCHQSLSWTRTIQSMPLTHFLNIHFNIILTSTIMFSEWSLSFTFRHQSPVCIFLLPHTSLTIRYLILLSFMSQIIFKVKTFNGNRKYEQFYKHICIRYSLRMPSAVCNISPIT